MIDILSIWLIVWILKTAAEDTLYAAKGRPNPRYELKRQKALAAGKAVPNQPRYGSRDWFGDLVSDGLAAQTERRRAKAAKKVKEAEKQAERDERPLDDLAEAVREEPRRPASTPRFTCSVCQEELTEIAAHVFEHPDGSRFCRENPSAQVDTEEFPEFESSVVHANDLDYVPGPHQLDPEYKGGPVSHVRCGGCQERFPLGVMVSVGDKPACPACAPKLSADRPRDTRPDATIIPFPNPKNTVKEISMATSEVTGLSTAIAFAEHAAAAHSSFATAGTEGYTGALVQHGVGGDCVGLAREAQEASNIAAAKWQAHADALKSQLGGQEFYRSNPDAGNKQFLVNE